MTGPTHGLLATISFQVSGHVRSGQQPVSSSSWYGAWRTGRCVLQSGRVPRRSRTLTTAERDPLYLPFERVTQATKGTRWMPWREEPMKDAVGGDSLGELPNELRSEGLRMGEPGGGHAPSPVAEYIGGVEGTEGTETSQYPAEEKSNEIPRVVASERGTAQTVPT